MNDPSWKSSERRKYIRIEKHFIITYKSKETQDKGKEISQLKNVSLGGMCFVANRAYAPDTLLDIELKTPYFSGTAAMDARVLQSHEKIPNLLYEIRVSFEKLDEASEFILKKIIDTFIRLQKEQKEE